MNKQKGFIIPAVPFIVVVLILVITGIFYLNKSNISKVLPPTTQPNCQTCVDSQGTSCPGNHSCFVPVGSSKGVCVPNPKPSQKYTIAQINNMCGTNFSDDETTDWKTYTHPLGFFSFKLPPEWSEDRRGSGNNPLQLYNFDINKFDSGNPPSPYPAGFLEIEIYLDTIPMSLENYVAGDKKESIELHGKEIERTWVEIPMILDDQPAIKTSDSRGGFGVYVQDPSKSIIIILSFSPDFDKNRDLANQIMATFRFHNR